MNNLPGDSDVAENVRKHCSKLRTRTKRWTSLTLVWPFISLGLQESTSWPSYSAKPTKGEDNGKVPDCTYPAIDGVGSCQNTAAGIQPSMDASLGDGDSTLLHHFMDGRAVHVGHLVKFIDANHTSVSKDHGPCFQAALP